MKRKITKYSGAELKSLRKSGKNATDWTRVKSMNDRDIDFSDSPEVTPEMFARAIVRRGLESPARKQQRKLVWEL